MPKCEVCGTESDGVRKSGYYQGVPTIEGDSNYKLICPDCQRYSNMYRTHGVTRKEFNDVLSRQDGKCAVCKCDNETMYPDKPKDANKDKTPLRGVLCLACKTLVNRIEIDMRNTCRALIYLGQGES